MKRNKLFASIVILFLVLVPFLTSQSKNYPPNPAPPSEEARPMARIEPIPALPELALVPAEPVAPVEPPPPPPPPPPPAPVFSGSCEDWIAAAGITDLYNARELIRRESGCNPYAMGSMTDLGRACGVAQELPCGKSGCQLGDGACQVSWMNRYVLGRYGSWAAAIAWHNKMNWY